MRRTCQHRSIYQAAVCNAQNCDYNSRMVHCDSAGLLQWGHTFTMVARKHLDEAAADGKPIADVKELVEEQWAKVC